MRAVSRVIEAILCSTFSEGKIVIVYEQLVSTKCTVLHISRIADINVQPAIIINIYECNTGASLFLFRKTSLCRNIFEDKISFIEIQFIAHLVTSEKNIRKAIIVNIACSYATTVVKIAVFENIKFL